MQDPQTQLDRFLDRFTPEIAARGRAILAWLRARLPGAVRLVYDNYNALVIAFGPTDRSSDAVLSVALYSRWINLFFADGAHLDDPDGRLKGTGKKVRHVRVDDVAVLGEPAIRALIDRAVAGAPSMAKGDGPLVIKAVVAKQRPRRP